MGQGHEPRQVRSRLIPPHGKRPPTSGNAARGPFVDSTFRNAWFVYSFWVAENREPTLGSPATAKRPSSLPRSAWQLLTNPERPWRRLAETVLVVAGLSGLLSVGIGSFRDDPSATPSFTGVISHDSRNLAALNASLDDVKEANAEDAKESESIRLDITAPSGMVDSDATESSEATEGYLNTDSIRVQDELTDQLNGGSARKCSRSPGADGKLPQQSPEYGDCHELVLRLVDENGDPVFEWSFEEGDYRAKGLFKVEFDKDRQGVRRVSLREVP